MIKSSAYRNLKNQEVIMPTLIQNTLAIVCGGGPAPGMNSVISSVTIEAKKSGWEVYGIFDGFSHLGTGEKKVIPLTIEMVSRIHADGGSILRTSRFNPTKSEESLRNVVDTLIELGVTHLVSIGGDDTAYAAFRIADYAKNSLGLTISFAHVPKTIDNDLPLPEGIPTFGFETARALGTQIVANLMEDAKTTGRWFIAVAMGRVAGHLALGIGKSAGATMIMIPEEFPSDRKIPLSLVVDIITGSIIKRLAAGRNYGVAVTAEGLIEKIRIEDLEAADCVEYDDHGHIRYAEINFSDVLKKELLANLYSLGIRMTVNNKEVGYEVRCAPPCAYDIEYTRNLGYAAMEFLRNGGSNAMITIQNDRIVPIPFEDIMDPVTKKTQVRMVNTDSIQYRIAREYTIRLEKRDFEPGIELDKLAVAAKMTPEEFRKRFEYVTDY
jgi:6-phosphofructokinase